MKLFNEKRSELEEEQLHLNVGLQKIHETVGQVEELQKSLSIKRNELEEKNKAANLKLKQMVRLYWLSHCYLRRTRPPTSSSSRWYVYIGSLIAILEEQGRQPQAQADGTSILALSLLS